ncbi:S8 family serine peptidase [Embleya sp. NPDC008237]|uniref:S8 family serine peptidase n=1 Tax=Embleya sp. NPDC008237 TaxID=3363978 RepID=UPI0036E52962
MGLGAAAVFLVLAVVATVLVVVLRGDDERGGAARPAVRAEDVLSARQLAQIRGARPDPSCAAAPGKGPGAPGLVALDVLRVDGTCLSTTTEYLPAADVGARQAVLARDPGVVVAAVAPPAQADAADDEREDQWALDALGVPEKSSELPWPDGTGVVVAVIDTGIDAAHPDFAGAVVGRRHYEGEGEPDPDGHGTHVAGIISARRNNGGIVGVAPGVSVLDVPVRLKHANDRGPSWSVGLAWAVNHGANVANMSLGSPLALYGQPDYHDAMAFAAAAVEFARHNDVVLVSSAGNCGSGEGDCDEDDQRQVPAALDGVVAVGAVKGDTEVTKYSTKNGDVDLVAPGGEHNFLLPPNVGHDGTVISTYPGGKYKWLRGTSQAAPHVAAAAAVGRFVSRQAKGDDIARALIDTADPNRVSWKDRSKPGAGHGFLNIPGMIDRLRTAPSPTPTGSAGPAGRTQAAFVQDGTLFAFDGGTPRPVRRVDPQAPLRWITWSADHTLLLGADERTLFSWAGPDTRLVEKPCDWCADKTTSPAFVENVTVTDPGTGAPGGDLVLRVDPDGTLTRYDAHTLDELGSTRPAYPAGAVGSKMLLGAVGGKLVVMDSGGAHALERLWLVDPVSGRVGASHEVAGRVLGDIAVGATGERIAVVTGWATCGRPDGVYVLGGGDLKELAKPEPPAGQMFDEVFFNGDTLYASMSGYSMPPGQPCKTVSSSGLWRLTGAGWEQVDPRLSAGRPFEGRPAGPATGWLAVRDGGAVLEPPVPDDPAKGNLGPVSGQVWSTPTRTEVPAKPPR